MKRDTAGRLALALLVSGVLCLSLAAVASAAPTPGASVCQHGGWRTLFGPGTNAPLNFTNQGACLKYARNGGAALGIRPSVSDGFAFFTVSGFGLMPSSPVTLLLISSGGGGQTFELVSPDGTIGFGFGPPCGSGVQGVAIGTTITTGQVQAAC